MMAEEPAMDFDDGGYGGAEDNLSMPLGDFMAFLESEPADDGAEDPRPEANQGSSEVPVDMTGFANGFERHEEFLEDEMQANQGSLEVPMDTTGVANEFGSHEEFLGDEGFWSQYQMEAMVEQGDGTFDYSDAKPLVGSDLSGNCRTTNHNNQPLPRDTLNHINAAEEANAFPYEVLSNCSYVGDQMYFGKAQVKAESHLEGMGPPTNTYLPCNQFPEQSGLSEVKSEDTGAILDNTGQEGNQYIPMNTFSLDHNAAIPDVSYTELNFGEATGSMNNGNSSCLTVQGDYLQGEFGECPKAEYGYLDMAGEMSLHDLPDNNQSYEMDQIPQNICESSSMQTGSSDQYCDDTSLSGCYMTSPESLSCEQIQSEYVGLKSESSTDSSPIPSSRNSTTEDADKYLGGSTKQLLNSSLVPISHQHPYRSLTDQMPPSFHEQQYDIHRSGNSFTRGNLSRSCFGANANGDSDLFNLSSHRAPGHLLPPQGIQGKVNNFQQSLSAIPFVPRFGGTTYKSHDERVTLRLALQDISQPKSETNPPDGLLSVPLLRHQKIALSWMVQKEKNGSHCSGGILADDQGLGKTISTISLILTERAPLPRSTVIKPELCEAVSLDDDDDDPTDLCLKRRSQTCSSEVTTSTTVKTENHIVEIKARPAAGTLVVCPTSVLRQWAEELRNKVTSKANLSFLVYHGSNRTKDPNELTKYDVVLTTYSIVSMEVPKQSSPDSDDEEKGKADRYGAPVSGSKKRKASSSKKTKKAATEKSNLPEKPLARVAWFRVILDEAQSIKNYRTNVAGACWNLRAKRRWCLSGTPIQNAVEDLFSYFKFLRYEPYCNYKQFCTMIKMPISRHPINGYKKLQVVLKTVMLRRTKATMLDGKPIISLPPKTISLKAVNFTSEERAFYNTLEAESRAQFKVYAAAGTVRQNYVNILLMLLRLRQACDHPHLVKGHESSWTSSLESANKLPMERKHELLVCLQSCSAICALCNDAPEDAVVTTCGHVFCNQCILEQLTGDDSICPVSNCRVRLNATSLFSRGTLEFSLCKSTSEFQSNDSCTEIVQTENQTGIDSSYASSKVRAALDIILSLPKVDPTHSDSKKTIGLASENINGKSSEHADTKTTEKAIVFSQWTRMLDLLEVHLQASHVTYRRLDGTMSVAAREKAVNDFKTVPEVSVMIMSLKAASLGLNMVAACHVLMLDLWWNPTTESSCPPPPPQQPPPRPRGLRRSPPRGQGPRSFWNTPPPAAMQSAAAIGLIRPCAARPILKSPSPGAARLPASRVALRLSAAAPRARLVAAAGLGRIGLVPASPEQEKRSGGLVAAAAAGKAAPGEEAGEESGAALAKTLQLGVFFGLWYLFNIYFNIYNKQVLKVFPYPINITTVQFAVGTTISLFMWATGILKRPKISGAQLLAILPLAIVHTMGNLFTNMSLGKVAVSFTHTIKAMEPFFSVLLSAMFLGELPTPWVVLSLLPIVGGVALASISEASFNWAGFLSAMASNVTFQSRNVLSKKLMLKKEASLDNINLFSIITVMSFFLLAPVTLLTEGVKVTPTFLQSAGLNLQQVYTRSLIAAFCFHAYQQVSYMILARVSPVTHSVGNCVKRVVVIVTSVLFFKTPVSPINSIGTAIALAGVFLYSQLKRLQPKPKAA